MAITRAAFQEKVDELAALKADVQTARQERDELNKSLQRANTALATSEQLRTQAEARARDLQSQLDSLPAAQLAAVTDEGPFGPRADEPRTMYPADGGARGQSFENLAAAESAQAAQPNYWFTLPEEAQARYAELMSEEITEEVSEITSDSE